MSPESHVLFVSGFINISLFMKTYRKNVRENRKLGVSYKKNYLTCPNTLLSKLIDINKKKIYVIFLIFFSDNNIIRHLSQR